MLTETNFKDLFFEEKSIDIRISFATIVIHIFPFQMEMLTFLDIQGQ